jgi:hypothetical protein
VETKLPEYPPPRTGLSIAQSVLIAGALLATVGLYDAWAKPPKDPAPPLYIVYSQIVPPPIQATLNEYRIVVVPPPPSPAQRPPPVEPSGRCDGEDADCLQRMRGHWLTPEQQEAMHRQNQERWCRLWGYCSGS